MSYLDKIIHRYWDLKEAVETTMKDRNCTKDAALSFLRSELDKFNNKTAQLWKKEWKIKTQEYKSSTPPLRPALAAPMASSSSILAHTINNINSAKSENTFNANVYHTIPQKPQTKKQRIKKETNNEKEIENFFNPPQNASNEQSSSMELKLPQLPITFDDVDPEDFERNIEEDLIVDGESILNKWIKCQVHTATQTRDEGVLVERDTQKILALSNILLLKDNQNCADLEEIFGRELLDSLRKHKYSDGDIYTRKASKDIMNLYTDDQNEAVNDLIVGIRNIVERIPKHKFNRDINERNLGGTYVDAIFRPFLENPDENKHFVWADVQVLENSSKLPDIVSRTLNNVSWEEPISIGEIKGEDKKNNVYENFVDLIRIGLVSKDSIDNNYYNGVLGVHVVGLQAAVYFTTLLASGLYIMLEVCSITMPRDVTQMRSYISTCEDLIPLHDLYKNWCKKASDIEMLKTKIKSGIDTPTCKSLIKTTKSRKRSCPFILNQ